MRFKVHNIVDSLAPVNFGIWNAAINTAPALLQNHQIASAIWYPATTDQGADIHPLVDKRPLQSTGLKELKKIAETLNPKTDIIVTHGCWRYPTAWGAWLRSRGFVWIYVPHGMLEPWSLEQKKWKKKLFFSFSEGPKAKRASGIRAVGRPEKANLAPHFPKAVLIANGSNPSRVLPAKPERPLAFLYLSRLHEKKRPLQLVQAWQASSLATNPTMKLQIVGPDDGERTKIESALASQQGSNIELHSAIFGTQKAGLLQQSHFFVLPSLSEGFPTSVVEALGEGLIPIISQGCNFPEVFEEGLAIDSGVEVETIKQALEAVTALSQAQIMEQSAAARQFAIANYSLETIARHQAYWYASFLK